MEKNYFFINGKIETLSYFSKKLMDCFSDMGYGVFMSEFYNPHELRRNITGADNTLITFNCIGVSGEEEYRNIWRSNSFKITNILVDHPMYYHDQLVHYRDYACDDYRVICIDSYHAEYVKRYYPDIRDVAFVPIAGSGEDIDLTQVKKEYDVIFTGNFTSCHKFDPYIEQKGPEYAQFYRGIIDDMLSDTKRPLERVCEEHILREFPDSSPDDMRLVMNNLLFVDLYVRFFLRERAIKELYKSGANIKLVGKGFEALGLCGTALMPTAFCLNETAKARISLNVMPWFKGGAHDRVLSSMLVNTLALTDTSEWFSDNFRDGSDIVFYDNMHMENLPDIVTGLLDNPSLLCDIAQKGREKALKSHTWRSRAELIK